MCVSIYINIIVNLSGLHCRAESQWDDCCCNREIFCTDRICGDARYIFIHGYMQILFYTRIASRRKTFEYYLQHNTQEFSHALVSLLQLFILYNSWFHSRLLLLFFLYNVDLFFNLHKRKNVGIDFDAYVHIVSSTRYFHTLASKSILLLFFSSNFI